MITVLVGENSFEVERALEQLATEFNGNAEKVDGSELELAQIPDLLMGVSLFADKRLMIIRGLSENIAVWANFSDWLERLSDDIHIVLVEKALDKRMKTYKDLQKRANVREFPGWSAKDIHVAVSWTEQEAKRHGITLSSKQARQIVERTGPDQWRIFHAIEKLAVLEEITDEIINETVDASPTENVFQLLETALKGDAEKMRKMIATLELGEDPHKVFGLLSSQIFQLAALTVTDKPSAEVAKNLGVHPFALSKMAPHAKKLGRSGAKKVIAVFAEADKAMKTSAADPWLLIERALAKMASERSFK